ncbi:MULTISPECIES: flagellar basal-body MS-ring/collar protein FliF [unclassified Variovorax]|uniref:flagellar basal-body MS-ring/collar protein FliF n=1 Tax=unclassified Variovorax TaxID=663243 RepID=UPI002577CE4B|nr:MULTISPECIES: flagellar basal-body MS-ring/collar protein FliF [unclassified Variovorax]MDM0089788.1 flagellar basal-body MS-ring/collar protein FliF [Variovorax sp. J22G40]MDM0148546.1 flagellar basal-body MS-ring/collar protein FliF [Variovorax sp. J2P1-31]
MSAVAELPAAALSAPPAPWAGRLAALDRRQRMRLAVGAVVLVAIAIAAIVLGRQPDWRVLYANLSDKDGGAVVAQLATMNVPYKYSEGGGAVMVPSDKVHDVRLRLASQGLPKGSVAGFELMENNRFGMTQFQEKLSFQRGLEGELTRSIQALGSVQSARVHLALPNQNGFFREQQKPSASVLLSLYPGRVLERSQIAGIVHLVASSVPELSPGAVSVLDDSGKLLSNTGDGPGGAAGAVDGQQLAYVQQLEQQYTRRILDILEPVVGRQNVKAQVTADVDFSQTEATSEEHRPNLAADASAVRSQQTVESHGAAAAGAAAATGVPGATSNQPPAPPSAPINGAAAPLAPTGTAAAAPADASKAPGKRESIINYEVDKTVKTVRGATGQIRRLSAAVVVNYQSIADAQGKASATALTPQQIEQMTALIRETIGFNKERGDSVNLMNTPFLVDANTPVDLPLWKRPEVLDLVRSFAWPVGLAVIGLIVLFGLVRPGIKAIAVAAPVAPALVPLPGAQLNAMVAETPLRPALASPEAAQALPSPSQEVPEQARLEGARQMARQNPVAVANIVKSWVNGDAAAGA